MPHEWADRATVVGRAALSPGPCAILLVAVDGTDERVDRTIARRLQRALRGERLLAREAPGRFLLLFPRIGPLEAALGRRAVEAGLPAVVGGRAYRLASASVAAPDELAARVAVLWAEVTRAAPATTAPLPLGVDVPPGAR